MSFLFSMKQMFSLRSSSNVLINGREGRGSWYIFLIKAVFISLSSHSPDWGCHFSAICQVLTLVPGKQSFSRGGGSNSVVIFSSNGMFNYYFWTPTMCLGLPDISSGLLQPYLRLARREWEKKRIKIHTNCVLLICQNCCEMLYEKNFKVLLHWSLVSWGSLASET